MIRTGRIGALLQVVLLGMSVLAFNAAAAATGLSAKPRQTVAPADARANPLIQGNQSPPLPAGPPGKLAVIASGSLATMIPANGAHSTFDLPVVVRNNTSKVQQGIKVTATARDASGTLVATGNTQLAMDPLLVKRGEIAIGGVYFERAPPADAKVSFKVTTTSTRGKTSILVTESNVVPVGGGFADLIGTVKNQTSRDIPLGSGPDVLGLCFSTSGQPTVVVETSADASTLPRGATAQFSDQIPGGNPECPIWLVGSWAFTF